MAGPAHLRARRSSRRSSGTSVRASSATRSTRATTRTTRTGCSSEIDWPVDGYRLFEIGHFIGDRDWFDGLWESNCLFVPRALLEQVGGFDESFSMPGGGYANLDLFERLGATPGRHRRQHPRRGLVPPGARRHDHEPARHRRAPARLIALPRALRASSAAGRSAGPASRCTTSAALAGRRCARGPAGATAQGVPARRRPIDADGRPERPDADPRRAAGASSSTPSGTAWRGATRPGSASAVEQAPTDLIAYQELLARVRPGLDRRDRHRRRRPGAVPRLDLRPARPRPGDLDPGRRMPSARRTRG